MKKIAFVLLLTLWGMGAWAQAVPTDTVRTAAAQPTTATSATVGDDDEDDEDDNEPNVIGGKVMRTNGGEANLIGDPVYYPLAQQTVRPEHHYLNSFRAHSNAFFLEGKTLIGSHDMAFGLEFAYVPKRLGAYGSVLFGGKHNYASVGPVLRVSSTTSLMDWQLYGGVITGCAVGAEGGIRVAQNRTHNHRFCWNSASMGMAWMNGRYYFVAGMSLELSAIVTLTTANAILFW